MVVDRRAHCEAADKPIERATDPPCTDEGAAGTLVVALGVIVGAKLRSRWRRWDRAALSGLLSFPGAAFLETPPLDEFSREVLRS